MDMKSHVDLEREGVTNVEFAKMESIAEQKRRAYEGRRSTRCASPKDKFKKRKKVSR